MGNSIRTVIITHHHITSFLYGLVIHLLIHSDVNQVIGVAMDDVLACSIEHTPFANSSLPAILFHALNDNLTFSVRVLFKYSVQYLNRSIRSAVIDEQIFNVVQSLLEQTSSTSLYVFLYPIDWYYNTYFRHIILKVEIITD